VDSANASRFEKLSNLSERAVTNQLMGVGRNTVDKVEYVGDNSGSVDVLV
jgi:hypothetical protein